MIAATVPSSALPTPDPRACAPTKRVETPGELIFAAPVHPCAGFVHGVGVGETKAGSVQQTCPPVNLRGPRGDGVIGVEEVLNQNRAADRGTGSRCPLAAPSESPQEARGRYSDGV